MKFEDILAKKVDMSKVKIGVLKPWITRRIYIRDVKDGGPKYRKTQRTAKEKPTEVLRAQTVANRTRTQQVMKESGRKLFKKNKKVNESF